MRTARGRQSQGERAATREVNTLVIRTARGRQSQGERAATREVNTLARRTARARETQQQASIPVYRYSSGQIQLPSNWDMSTSVPIAMPSYSQRRTSRFVATRGRLLSRPYAPCLRDGKRCFECPQSGMTVCVRVPVQY